MSTPQPGIAKIVTSAFGAILLGLNDGSHITGCDISHQIAVCGVPVLLVGGGIGFLLGFVEQSEELTAAPPVPPCVSGKSRGHNIYMPCPQARLGHNLESLRPKG